VQPLSPDSRHFECARQPAGAPQEDRFGNQQLGCQVRTSIEASSTAAHVARLRR
jgi:hypothetical protein